MKPFTIELTNEDIANFTEYMNLMKEHQGHTFKCIEDAIYVCAANHVSDRIVTLKQKRDA